MLSTAALVVLVLAALLAALLTLARTHVVTQLVAGVLVVALVYRLALLIMRADRLVVAQPSAGTSRPTRVDIVKGYALTAAASDRVWSTTQPYAPNYAPLARSVNRRGGAQFTYQFWLYVGDASPENVGERTLLLRGSNAPRTWTKTVATPAVVADVVGVPTARTDTQTFADQVLIKCPQIAFGPTHDSFVVTVNTLHDPNTVVEISPDAAPSDSTARKNLLKLTTGQWALHTFTFEDNVAITDFEDGIRVRYYLNDTLYHTARLPSSLRQNNGDFYLLPSLGDAGVLKDCRIGGVAYYNTAIDADEVRATLRRGPPTQLSTDVEDGLGGDASAPLYVSEFNKIDAWNT